MSNWKEKIAKFMYGRYGANDTLNKWLLGAFIILLLLSMLLQSRILNLLALAALIYAYFRMFSRNVNKRIAENRKFIELTEPVRRIFSGKKFGTTQDKTHRLFNCPQCHQKVRVPKGRGKICITCPKCRTEFVKRS